MHVVRRSRNDLRSRRKEVVGALMKKIGLLWSGCRGPDVGAFARVSLLRRDLRRRYFGGTGRCAQGRLHGWPPASTATPLAPSPARGRVKARPRAAAEGTAAVRRRGPDAR